jgi:hypothetical protein
MKTQIIDEKELVENYIKFPVKGDNGGYIWDAEGKMIAQIRGWGYLEKIYGGEKACQIQDATCEFLAAALNAYGEAAEHKRFVAEWADRFGFLAQANPRDSFESIDEVAQILGENQEAAGLRAEKERLEKENFEQSDLVAKLQATLDGDPSMTAAPEQRRAWRLSAVRYADELEVTIESLLTENERLNLENQALSFRDRGWKRIEELPEKDGEYLVMCEFTKAGERHFGKKQTIEIRDYCDGDWDFIHPNFGKFVAWQFLPLPFTGETEE